MSESEAYNFLFGGVSAKTQNQPYCDINTKIRGAAGTKKRKCDSDNGKQLKTHTYIDHNLRGNHCCST